MKRTEEQGGGGGKAPSGLPRSHGPSPGVGLAAPGGVGSAEPGVGSAEPRAGRRRLRGPAPAPGLRLRLLGSALSRLRERWYRG